MSEATMPAGGDPYDTQFTVPDASGAPLTFQTFRAEGGGLGVMWMDAGAGLETPEPYLAAQWTTPGAIVVGATAATAATMAEARLLARLFADCFGARSSFPGDQG